MSDEKNYIATHTCGSQEIHGADMVMVSAGIAGWSKGDDGMMAPDWEGGSDVHWDSQVPEHADLPYFCRGCDHYCSEADLVFVTEDEFREEEEEGSEESDVIEVRE